jgi:hypothetical protein
MPQEMLNPRVAVQNDDFLAVWWQGGVPRQLWAARVTSGGVLAEGPRRFGDGLEPDVAVSQSGAAVVYTDEESGVDSYCLPVLWWAELNENLTLGDRQLIGTAGATGRLFEYEIAPARSGYRVASREETWRRGAFDPIAICAAPVFTEISSGTVVSNYIPGIDPGGGEFFP